jgi:hypothetical protein
MKARDLRKEPPRSPHVRIHDYVILARTLDKGRASLNGALGDFHFDCPLDNQLFGFKGINAAEFLGKVQTGATDEEMGQWLDEHGTIQTPGSISQWSQSMEAMRPYENPDQRSWFIEKCKPLGLNPANTTLFGFLDADDKASFPNAQPVAYDQKNWDLPLVDTAAYPSPSVLRSARHS